MKQNSKDKLIQQSINGKLEEARKHKASANYPLAIEFYHKALFLKEDGAVLVQLGEIYEDMYDIATAIILYRRAAYLTPTISIQEKISSLTLLQGLQLLSIGSVKNILEDTTFVIFIKRYPIFHKKLLQRVGGGEKQDNGQGQGYGKNQNQGQKQGTTAGNKHLECCLAYLQVNQRQLALEELEKCIIMHPTDVDIVVLKGMLLFSLMEESKGYKTFWQAYKIDKGNAEVQIFLQMITPQIDTLYKQAKYQIIDKRVEKCKLKVKRGLEIHPYHTQFLILSAYLHRIQQQYQHALSDLQLANKTLQDKSMEEQLRSQISLTYNQMGIYLYKQHKFSQAITLFTEGLSFKPKDWGMLTNRGDCYRAMNLYVKALEDYHRAYDLQKKNDDLSFRISCIYSIRGISLFNSKNFDLALREFQQSLRFSPRCSQFHISKAKCLLQLNRKQQALQSIEATLQIEPKHVQALHMYNQLKDPDQTKSKGRKVILLSKEK